MSDEIESILIGYSIFTDREDDWLPNVILKKDVVVNHPPPSGLNRFLERFSKERPFGNVAQDAISSRKINKETIVDETRISADILEKVLTNKAPPNIIPLKKMVSLLYLLQIPLMRAVESFRVSLSRIDMGQSLQPLFNLPMRRKREFPFNSQSGEKSRESANRDLEVYIKRLLKESI